MLSVGDRRFHLESISCPDCGPRVQVLTPEGDDLEWRAPVPGIVRALEDGLVVAIKGTGGFRLFCDATCERAVRRLRTRKGSIDRPFPVLVADLDAALRLAELSDERQRLLLSDPRPIVLAPVRDDAPLAAEVTLGLRLVGIALADQALELLVAAAFGQPLVRTSGNLHGEPIALRNDEAVERLGDLADLVVVHDRAIGSRVVDSVVTVVAGRPMVLRRSLGFVPKPVRMRRSLVAPILAAGEDRAGAFAFGVGTEAILGSPVGDLSTEAGIDAFGEAVERWENLLGVVGEVVAHDLAPESRSAAWVRGHRPAKFVAVQHHHALVASVMADRGVEGPVFGVALDDGGFGSGGSLWGGEILVVTAGRSERIGTLRPSPLVVSAGNGAASWQPALALLDDAFGGSSPFDRLELFAGVGEVAVADSRAARAKANGSRRSHSAGRILDALAAVIAGRPVAEGLAFDSHVGVEPTVRQGYDFEICDGRPGGGPKWEIDLRPMVRAAVDDRTGGTRAGSIAAKIARTFAEAVVGVLRQSRGEFGPMPVVLAGSCFTSDLLVCSFLDAIFGDFVVHRSGDIPPGDGGVALGQLLVADAQTRDER